MLARLTAALAAALALVPGVALAASGSAIHTIDREVLDARGLTGSVKTRFEGKHTGSTVNPYMVDMTVKKMGGGGLGGHFVFREQDPDNFYDLVFRQNRLELKKEYLNVTTTVATGGRGWFVAGVAYRVRLILEGARIRVYEYPDLAAPVIDWTDPANPFLVGRNVSYYANTDTLFCYEQVEARPVPVALELGHAVLLGGSPGYQAPQQEDSSSPSIGSSRYPFTFERYDSPSDDGSGAWDMIQGGFGGTGVFRVGSTAAGASFVYRAANPTATGLPRSGYAVRLETLGTRWGVLDSAGTFTAVASGRPVLPGEDAYVRVTATTHRVETAAGEVIVPTQTHSAYSGLRSYVGHLPGTTGRLRGSYTPL